jgi:hypothetical protein
LSYVLRCLTLIFIVISWFCAPVFFQPYPTSHQLDIDWEQAKQWLQMPCRALNDSTRTTVSAAEAETSWAAWHVLTEVKNWGNEESSYAFLHIFVIALVRMLFQYVPWFTMFLMYVQEETMYFVLAVFMGQILHAVLVAKIDPSQHHYLSVIELVALVIALPCALFYYTLLTTALLTDILFGACIYIVIAFFALDLIVLGLRGKYRWQLRNQTDEKILHRARLDVAMAAAPYRQSIATICMIILYVITYVACFFKSSITSINYSSAASFAWERVHILPREISIIAAEPLDKKR